MATPWATVLLLLAACTQVQGLARANLHDTSRRSIWRDASAALEDRVADLLDQLNPLEKASLFYNTAPAIPRLGIQKFEWWTECLHGLLEHDSLRTAPTLFPQPLVLASTFDTALVHNVFSAVSDEARAKNNEERNLTGGARNLVCWSPHMNLFRDPRWGRGSETYGEDPYLTSRMAVAVVQGLQGDHPHFVKAAATCKHFWGYSFEGAEGESRMVFDADISPQDAADTYLPAFEACVKEGKATGIMCSYNAVNGVPSCANDGMLRGQLREGWGFKGYVVSDCGAVSGLTPWAHGWSSSNEEALGAAVNASCDLMCDGLGASWVVLDALRARNVTQAALDESLARTLAVRFRVGEFDDPGDLPWAHLGPSTINSLAHQRLAHEAAVKGIVLLKNDPPGFGSDRAHRARRCDPLDDQDVPKMDPQKPLLPLDKSKLGHRLCVLGPLADSPEHMLGNYYGHFSDHIASPLRAIEEALVGTGTSVIYAMGAHLLGVSNDDIGGGSLENSLTACRGASLAVMFLGASTINQAPQWTATDLIRPVSENEGMDRKSLGLAGRQQDLVMAFARRAPNTAIAVVLMHAGPVDVSWLQESPRVAAILSVGQPGQEGGYAVADVLFGAANPSGRLPNTWYHSNYSQAVSLLDMRMRPEPSTNYPGRSYRFFGQPVLYPFGHGLSYTSFEYIAMDVTQGPPTSAAVGAATAAAPAALLRGDAVASAQRSGAQSGHVLLLEQGGSPVQCIVRVALQNSGQVAGEEVVMLFLTYLEAVPRDGAPLRSLRAFNRTALLPPGYGQEVLLPLGPSDFSLADTDGSVRLKAGSWRIAAAGLHVDVDVQLKPLGVLQQQQQVKQHRQQRQEQQHNWQQQHKQRAQGVVRS